MSSITHTQPQTGRRNFNLRAYLAGTAATAALIGAVVLVFASLGAYVAFNGLPIGGSDSDTDASSVAIERAVVHDTANRSQGQQNIASANVRRADANARAVAANGGRPSASGSSGAADTASGPVSTATEPAVSASGSDQPTAPSPTQTGPSDDSPSTTIPNTHVTTPDSVGGTVGTVEQTLHDAGINVPLTGSGSVADGAPGALFGGN